MKSVAVGSVTSHASRIPGSSLSSGFLALQSFACSSGVSEGRSLVSSGFTGFLPHSRISCEMDG